MPILALKEVHHGEPTDITARVFAGRSVGLAVAHAVDEAHSMEREDQADCAKPEKGGKTEIQTAKI